MAARASRIINNIDTLEGLKRSYVKEQLTFTEVAHLLPLFTGRAIKFFALAWATVYGKAGHASLAPLLALIIKRGDLYRAHLARLVKPQHAPRRAPRPLHTHPRPPAAPLAPPVL